MKPFLFLVCLIFTAGLVFFLLFFHYQLTPLLTENGEVYFTIRKGAGFQEIAEDLEEKGLIRSAASFKFYLLLKGWADKLKPGYYRLSRNLSATEIAQILVEGNSQEVKVTIPEGWTIFQIEKKLKEVGVLEKDVFLSQLKVKDFLSDEGLIFLKNLPSNVNLEGFLFPDTYRFEINSPPEQVARKMLKNFYQRFFANFSEKLKEKNVDLYSLVKMASLIEAEIPHSSDRPLVSGILWKRLRNNLPLQVDATIVYYKCNFLKEENCRFLKGEDLNIISPYNSYLYLGFPPTPIANPGLDALEAAFNPVNSSYFYYLSDPKTGNTIFAKTLEEHNLNIKKYLQR